MPPPLTPKLDGAPCKPGFGLSGAFRVTDTGLDFGDQDQNSALDPGTKTMATISLSKKQREDLLKILKARFEQNMSRHKDVAMAQPASQARSQPRKVVVAE